MHALPRRSVTAFVQAGWSGSPRYCQSTTVGSVAAGASGSSTDTGGPGVVGLAHRAIGPGLSRPRPCLSAHKPSHTRSRRARNLHRRPLWTHGDRSTVLVGSTDGRVPWRHRRRIERIVTERPRVSADELAAATATVGPFLKRQARLRQAAREMNPWTAALRGVPFLFALTAIVAVLSAWLFRGGLFLRALNIAVVTKNGEPVSRLRALWRGLGAWGGFFIVPFLMPFLATLGGPPSAAALAWPSSLLPSAHSVWRAPRGRSCVPNVACRIASPAPISCRDEANGLASMAPPWWCVGK